MVMEKARDRRGVQLGNGAAAAATGTLSRARHSRARWYRTSRNGREKNFVQYEFRISWIYKATISPARAHSHALNSAARNKAAVPGERKEKWHAQATSPNFNRHVDVSLVSFRHNFRRRRRRCSTSSQGARSHLRIRRRLRLTIYEWNVYLRPNFLLRHAFS